MMLLVSLARFDEAIAEGERAVELDPLSPVINVDLGITLYFARRYDESARQLRKTLALDPAFFYAHFNLGGALAGERRSFPARWRNSEEAEQLSDNAFVHSALLRAGQSQAGDKNAGPTNAGDQDLSPGGRYREVDDDSLFVAIAFQKKKEEALRSPLTQPSPAICDGAQHQLDQGRSSARFVARRSALRCFSPESEPRQKRQIIHDAEALACHVGSRAKADAKGHRQKEMKIDNFFAELKRRNVYKVAVAYAVVGGLAARSSCYPSLPVFRNSESDSALCCARNRHRISHRAHCSPGRLN